MRGPGEKLTVRLHKAIPVPVRVVDDAGRPVVGTRIQLLQKLEKDPDPTVVHRIHRRFGSSHWSNYLELAVATTGNDGIANIAWQPWDGSSRLRATGTDHITTCSCRGRRRVLAMVRDPGAIERILAHLGLPTGFPPRGPPRAVARRLPFATGES